MSCYVDVNCPKPGCYELFEYSCETEDSGAGSEHQAKCPECGTSILFEIEYEPVASNERASDE